MKLCATIIEDRLNYVDLLNTVHRHASRLPKQTEMMVFCDVEMYSKVDTYVCQYFLPWTIIPLPEKMSIEKYNELLTTAEFWDFFKNFDRVLIFQNDSGLLRSGIEEFYKWDYIGGEWAFVPHVGNGGLSLRNPKVMKSICEKEKYQYHIHGPEDTYFCNIMRRDNMNLATVEEARKFSVESIFTLGSMGYHAIEKYLTPDQCKQIYEQYN